MTMEVKTEREGCATRTITLTQSYEEHLEFELTDEGIANGWTPEKLIEVLNHPTCTLLLESGEIIDDTEDDCVIATFNSEDSDIVDDEAEEGEWELEG